MHPPIEQHAAPTRQHAAYEMIEKRNISGISSAFGEETPRFRIRLLLVALLLLNILNYLDRQLPFILAESIRQDIGLSDTELGLLGGLGFALVYALFSLPIAWLADRKSPTAVIAGAITVWSAMTLMTGFAQQFWHILVGRFGVAAGEAGSTPPAHAIIARYFPPENRATAIGLFAIGVPIGTMLGMMVGGWLGSIIGWRTTFIVMGIPGLLLALVFVFITPVPPVYRDPNLGLSWRCSMVMLWTEVRYRRIVYAAMAFSASSYSIYAFLPTFLMRVQGMPIADAGITLGLLHGICGSVGILAGGALTDRLARHDPRWKPWIAGISLFVSAPLLAAALLAPTAVGSIWLLVIPLIAWSVLIPALWTMAQDLAPPDARATSSALLSFCCTAFAGSVGPLFVGSTSDWLAPQVGSDSLRYAMLGCVVALTAGAVFFMLAARSKPLTT